MLLDLPVLRKGQYYYIKENNDNLIMEDKTKRGLEIKETSIDERTNVIADKGMIYDMDGIGHRVPIRWYFPKSSYNIDRVLEHAESMEKKYIELRELTCPDD